MTRQVADTGESGRAKGHVVRVVDHVVEQRASNLAQGLLTLIMMTGPLLIVLHLVPQGVLAGLFFIMGIQALEGNGITAKILYLCTDRELVQRSDPLRGAERRGAVWGFVGLELVGFGATFAITQTIAAIGFPVFILLLVPVRTWVLPKFFGREELALLDQPTASPFTMESVGGNFGEEVTMLPVVEEPSHRSGRNSPSSEGNGLGGAGLSGQGMLAAGGEGIHQRRMSNRDHGEDIELKSLRSGGKGKAGQ